MAQGRRRDRPAPLARLDDRPDEQHQDRETDEHSRHHESDLGPIGIEDFAALPAHRPLATYAPIERRGARVEGYLQRVGHSTDGDFHMMLIERAAPGARPRYLTIEITPAWSRRSRHWTVERLAALTAERAADGRAPRVRISGWLMYDWWADAVPGWVFDRARRVSAWEVHPVTRIEYWDESRKAMVDLAP